jgi:hypothetical protein
MNGLDAVAAMPNRKFSPSMLMAAWRGITREQIIATFLLGCMLHLYRVVVTIDVRYAAYIFVADQLKAFALLLAIAAADYVTGKDPDRRGPYALAVFLGSLLIVPISTLTTLSFIKLFIDRAAVPPGRLGFALNIFFELLMVAWATVWVINDRRRARRARTRMHVAELARIRAERLSIESDLQAMQARIEPRFLLDTLRQVGHLFERNHLAGEQLLDALIAYLRAAIPGTHDGSTIGQEVALVRAYLAIPRPRTGEVPLMITGDSVEFADARMPAMLLLPLIDRAISVGSSGARLAVAIDISVSIVEEVVRFQISVTPVSRWLASADDKISAVRARLRALYGDRATLLMLRQATDGMNIILTTPYERSLRQDVARQT